MSIFSFFLLSFAHLCGVCAGYKMFLAVFNNNNNLYLYSVISTKKPVMLYNNNTCKIYDNNT